MYIYIYTHTYMYCHPEVEVDRTWTFCQISIKVRVSLFFSYSIYLRRIRCHPCIDAGGQPLQSLQPLSGSLQTWQTCTPRSAFRGWAIPPSWECRAAVYHSRTWELGWKWVSPTIEGYLTLMLYRKTVSHKNCHILEVNPSFCCKAMQTPYSSCCVMLSVPLYTPGSAGSLYTVATVNSRFHGSHGHVSCPTGIWGYLVGWWVSAEAFESWPLQRFPGSRH